MTPKQKAEKLVNNYINVVLQDFGGMDKDLAKQCALIAVDEVLDFRNALYLNEGSLAHQYLLEVKQEIEKL